MNYWNDKRVLVTGGSGFIGSHLTRRLVNLGAEVAVTVKYNSVIDNVRIVDVWDNIKVIEVDLRNVDSLNQLSEFSPSIIFHLAAYNHVGDSFSNVGEALNSNTIATANLIEAYENFERFIYISSSEIYGHQTGFPFTESMAPAPISPYSIGKYGGELYCRMKMEHLKKPIVILRPFNAFGPYQSKRAVISELIDTCLSGKPLLTTDGKQTREFNFVENLVDSFVLAAHKDEAIGHIINIGSGEEISIRDLAKEVHNLTNSSSELRIGELANRPTEIWRMATDTERAKYLLGWEPKVSFKEGLQHTVNWYKEYRKEYHPRSSGLSRLAQWMYIRSSETFHS